MGRLSVQLFAFNASIAKELKERIALLASGELKPLAAPSEYQRRIFEWTADGRGSAIVRAVAGSGKTTTMIHNLQYVPNIDVRDVRAGTFHSVGYGAILKKLGLPAASVKPDGGKVKRLMPEGLGEIEYETYGSFVEKLVGLAKGDGIGCLVPDTPDAWYGLISHHDMYLDAEDATEARAVELARRFLGVSNEMAKNGSIDFNDMLYLPLLWRLRLWQNDWVVIDEAQDTNPTRRALAKLALRPGGRLIAVGDDRQAIYGFTGASHDAMDLIKRDFSCVELPLTISYRCPKAVGEKVREIVPYFETAPGAAEGEVRWCSFDDAIEVLDRHDAILCRNTAPLISTFFRLTARGTGCVVLGKDIGDNLITLVKKQKAAGLDRLQEKLEVYCDREVAKYTAKGEEQKAEAVADRVDCITAVIENLHENERTVPRLLDKLGSMFSDANGLLTLATVHKVKGSEYRRVAILRPDLMPSKWARQEWQALQEKNIEYVAWSRAKEQLMFLADDGKKGGAK